MLKKTLFIAVIVLCMVFFACKGGQSLDDPILREQGKVLNFEQALGKTYTYAQKSERGIYFNFQGSAFSPREVCEGKVDIKVDAFSGDGYTIDFNFAEQQGQMMFDAPLKPRRERLPSLDISFTSYVNPAQFYIRDNVDLLYTRGEYDIDIYDLTLAGKELTLYFDNEGGLKQYLGLTGLTSGGFGMNKEEELAFEYGGIITPAFPNRALKAGDKWESKYNRNFTAFGGSNMDVAIDRNFELRDFVLYQDHECAHVRVTMNIDITHTGDVEDFGGIAYQIDSKGSGTGRADIYFSFDGHIVEARYNWFLDFNFKIKNQQTGVEYSDVYSARRTEELKLAN